MLTVLGVDLLRDESMRRSRVLALLLEAFTVRGADGRWLLVRLVLERAMVGGGDGGGRWPLQGDGRIGRIVETELD